MEETNIPKKKNIKKKKKQFQTVFSNFESKIFIFLISLIIIGIVVFILKYRKHVDCEGAEFTIVAENYSTQEVIEFDNNTKNASQWVWDFGDKTPKEFRKQALHKYAAPGLYTVTLTINGFCTKEKQIEIKDLGDITDNSKIPKIIAPELVAVGDTIVFKYKFNREETFSWEWSFGETGKIDKTDESPAYSYNTPGTKIVSLIINGNTEYKSSKNIIVKPRKAFKNEKKIDGYVYQDSIKSFNKPMGNPSTDKLPAFIKSIPINTKESLVPKIGLDISEDKFELLVYQLANQTKEKEDFAEYICANYQIPVVINTKKVMSFAEFCKKIKGKEIKIESLRLTKNNLNCIDGFSISYKIKKYFIWMND